MKNREPRNKNLTESPAGGPGSRAEQWEKYNKSRGELLELVRAAKRELSHFDAHNAPPCGERLVDSDIQDFHELTCTVMVRFSFRESYRPGKIKTPLGYNRGAGLNSVIFTNNKTARVEQIRYCEDPAEPFLWLTLERQ